MEKGRTKKRCSNLEKDESEWKNKRMLLCVPSVVYQGRGRERELIFKEEEDKKGVLKMKNEERRGGERRRRKKKKKKKRKEGKEGRRYKLQGERNKKMPN